MSEKFFAEKFEMIDILPALKVKYSKYLRKNITKVMIVQDEVDVILETTTKTVLDSGLEKISILRENLDFISEPVEVGSDLNLFNVEDDIAINVDKFINELGAYSISMALDLFDLEASKEIDETLKDNQGGINGRV